MAGRKPGTPKTGGRAPGTPNKTTALMKNAMMAVYEQLQTDAGGDHSHFKSWAADNPTEFYKLASKLLPIQAEHSGPDGAPIEHALDVSKLSTATLREIADAG